MRIAVCGKGGVGKTTFCGTLCRALGRKGVQVLAIDGDPNPNLSLVLGMGTDGDKARPIGVELMEKVAEMGGKSGSQRALSKTSDFGLSVRPSRELS